MYTLGGPEGRTPIPSFDNMAWDKWMGRSFKQRIVAQEDVGDFWVSTVFLGTNCAWGDNGPPILFETMVFVKKGESVRQERCSTWKEAEVQHRKMVAEIRSSRTPWELRALWEPQVLRKPKSYRAAGTVLIHEASRAQRKLLE